MHDERAGCCCTNCASPLKRLRYTLEMFTGVFGAIGDLQIERVKAIQESLGELHDCDVRIQLIEG
ncbi:MAG: CHAD domain-containing protein [Thermomicrobiales bacterium]